MAEEHTTELRPFGEWLGSQRRGALEDELTAAMHELVEAVSVLGRKGSLTLKLEVKPHAAGVVIVSDDVTTRPPREDRPGAIWFVDSNHELSRTDPLQTSLPLTAEALDREVTTDDQ